MLAQRVKEVENSHESNQLFRNLPANSKLRQTDGFIRGQMSNGSIGQHMAQQIGNMQRGGMQMKQRPTTSGHQPQKLRSGSNYFHRKSGGAVCKITDMNVGSVRAISTGASTTNKIKFGNESAGTTADGGHLLSSVVLGHNMLNKSNSPP